MFQESTTVSIRTDLMFSGIAICSESIANAFKDNFDFETLNDVIRCFPLIFCLFLKNFQRVFRQGGNSQSQHPHRRAAWGRICLLCHVGLTSSSKFRISMAQHGEIVCGTRNVEKSSAHYYFMLCRFQESKTTFRKFLSWLFIIWLAINWWRSIKPDVYKFRQLIPILLNF